jgi:ribonuclease HII
VTFELTDRTDPVREADAPASARRWRVKRIAARVHRPPRIAGIDEAGRGPLAGPVVAAAVILNPRRRIEGLADSKVLPPEERERLAAIIRERALSWSVAWADRDEIDSLNILGATFLAMRRALLGLPVCPTHIQIDGNQLPRIDDLNLGCTVEAIIEGDATVAAISAASILAKTCRDAMMRELDRCYPGFHLGIHKGYGTPLHLEALRELEPTPLHRRSFSPVRVAFDALNENAQLQLLTGTDDEI